MKALLVLLLCVLCDVRLARADTCPEGSAYPGVEVASQGDCAFLVFYRKSADNHSLASLMGQPSAKVRSIAVLIGVSKYPGLDDPAHGVNWDLPAARNDIDKLTTLLRDGQQFDEIYRIVDEQATRQTVQHFLSGFVKGLGSSLAGPARLLIAYSGHGTGESAAGEGSLVPADTRNSGDPDQMIPFSELAADLRTTAKHPDWQVLTLINACHSGQVLGGVAIAAGERIGAIAGGGSHVLLAGSDKFEVRTTLPQDSDDGKVYSLFFHNLFRALELMASDHAADPTQFDPIDLDALASELAAVHRLYGTEHGLPTSSDGPWRGTIPGDDLKPPTAGFILFPVSPAGSTASTSATTASAAPAATDSTRAAQLGTQDFSEAAFWNMVVQLGHSENYQTYLKVYPQGPHSAAAQAALRTPGGTPGAVVDPAWRAVAWSGPDGSAGAPGLLRLALQTAGADAAHRDTAQALARISAEDWNNAPAERLLVMLGEDLDPAQLEALARAGERQAQWLSGLICSQGLLGHPVDSACAMDWYLRAAAQHFARAENSLGSLYETRLHAHVQALGWYRQSSGHGNSFGQANLARFFRDGQWVTRDLPQAQTLFSASAGQGNPYAQSMLGDLFAERGSPEDWSTALGWYRKAAGQDYPYAQTLLGRCYQQGKGTRADPATAVSWFQRAARLGDDDAALELGYAYLHGNGVTPDVHAAIEQFKQAAQHGLAAAGQALAYAYSTQLSQPGQDREAARWARSAAESGSPYGQFLLGWTYEHGVGQAADLKQAAQWYAKAAEGQDHSAQEALARFYTDGLGGLAKDPQRAAALREQAHEAHRR